MKLPSSSWPARWDVLESLSGLLLALFIWAHMFFESSILLGLDAMYAVTRLFEGEFLFGRPYPALVSLAVATIFALILLHAILALRKFPSSYAQYSRLHGHLGGLRHADSTLWYLQVVTGFALMFLTPIHLYPLLVEPSNIGPFASSDRVWSGGFWPLYALLLLAVHVHAAAGVYRLAVKWNLLGCAENAVRRKRLRVALTLLCLFFLTLGTVSLATYMQIGAEHAPRAGERYVPAAGAG